MHTNISPIVLFFIIIFIKGYRNKFALFPNICLHTNHQDNICNSNVQIQPTTMLVLLISGCLNDTKLRYPSFTTELGEQSKFNLIDNTSRSDGKDFITLIAVMSLK